MLNSIVIGDAKKLLKKLDDSSVDLVLTDPPFGTGIYKTDQEPSIEIWKEIRRVGKELYAVFGYAKNLMKWSIYFSDLKLIGYIVWHIYNYPQVSQGLTRVHQDIAIWGKSEKQIKANEVREPYSMNESLAKWSEIGTNNSPRSERLSKIAKPRHKDGRRCSDLWAIASPGAGFNSHLRKHPNEKPEDVIKRLILLLTEPGDIVLDPFTGSGTIPAVCKMLNRSYIAYEIVPEYGELARTRLLTITPALF